MTASDIVEPVTRVSDDSDGRSSAALSKRWTTSYARKLAITDLVVLFWTFFATHLFIANLPQWSGEKTPYHWPWILASLGVIAAWFVALTLADTRDPRVIGAGPSEYKRIVNATVTTFASLAFFGYMFQRVSPRSYVLLALGLGTVLLILSRWSWRQWLFVNRQNGRMTTDAVAVGSEAALRELVVNLHATPHAGYRIVGICLTNPIPSDTLMGIPVLGDVSEVVELAVVADASSIIVAASDAAHPDMVRRLGWELEGYDIDLILAPALANIAGPRVHIRPVAGLPLLHIERPAYQGAQRWSKILLDRLGSIALIVVGSLIMIPAAIAVKTTSRGPVIYRQERVGRDGQMFEMFKFRTMVDGADNLIGTMDMAPDAGNDFMFKMKDDPRVTRVGRFLRRFSIDELPQLFNVLRGDMSLVGPRPPLMREVSGYHIDAKRRLLVRPGVTGLWQVSGRSDLDWEETIRLDLYYVENWSMMGDLVILWRTARAVLSSRGAY